MTKRLALLACVKSRKAMPEDLTAASQLNDRLLDQQANDLREKFAVTDHT